MDVEPLENFSNCLVPKTEPTDLKEDILDNLENKCYKCNDCGFATDWATSFQSHLLIHEDEHMKPYKGGLVKSRTQAGPLKLHIQTDKKLFVCKVCKAVFPLRGALKSHELTHTQKRPFKCKECGAGFNQSGTLKTHELVHSQEKPFQCSDFGKSFNQSRHLRTHMFSHTGVKPFHCSVCGKTFTRADNMKTHLEYAHSGRKPYKCVEHGCHQAYARADDLERHALIHAGEEACSDKPEHEKSLFSSAGKTVKLLNAGPKPYKCGLCEGAFNLASSLKRHQTVHIGIKNFKCHICGSAFTRKSDLKKHIVCGDSHFTCSICDTTFQKKKALKTHIFNIHKDII